MVEDRDVYCPSRCDQCNICKEMCNQCNICKEMSNIFTELQDSYFFYRKTSVANNQTQIP